MQNEDVPKEARKRADNYENRKRVAREISKN
jgi:hypothetical protein